jgi:hypothetical protein
VTMRPLTSFRAAIDINVPSFANFEIIRGVPQVRQHPVHLQ